jgi:hypothetical protein
VVQAQQCEGNRCFLSFVVVSFRGFFCFRLCFVWFSPFFVTAG